jgi:hypothetical protein
MARRATKAGEESPLVGRTPTSALDPQVQPFAEPGGSAAGQGTRPTNCVFNRVAMARRATKGNEDARERCTGINGLGHVFNRALARRRFSPDRLNARARLGV